jgi:molybdopterin molybdotransferase
MGVALPGRNDEILVPLAEVQQLVLDAVRPLPATGIPIGDAVGTVTAEDVVAVEDVPPFPNTAMDGYAVRALETVPAPVELEVVGVLAAGQEPTVAVGPLQAVQIMTGAPIPPGATGIAIIERTEAVRATGARRVRILDQVDPGAHIRPAGSDFSAGAVAIAAGTPLAPAHIGVLASIGASRVRAYRRPRIGVLSTGDELVEAVDGESAPVLAPGQIRDSNRHALLATLRRDGFDPVDLGLVRDDEEEVSASLTRAARECDAVLTSGGVSKGEFDYVKLVLGRLAEPPTGLIELSVAIRPAKPFAFALLAGGGERSDSSGDPQGDDLVPAPAAGGVGSRQVPVFGLPGNPVSSLVSYQMIALPALRVLAGHPPEAPRSVKGVATDPLPRRPNGRIHLDRVEARWREDGRLAARSAGGQLSHQLSSMAAANALAVVPDGDGIEAGEEVELVVFGPLK